MFGLVPLTLLGLLLSLATGARAEVYPLVGTDSVVGANASVAAYSAETLFDVGRRHGLGYEEITRANPSVDPWLPADGARITLATQFVLPAAPRRGIVLNLAEYRLYFYPDKGRRDDLATVMTYPISIGRMDWETPLGTTRVVAMALNPTWYPPDSVRAEHAAQGDRLPRVVPPGPDNPLGRHAIRLALPGYLIHGTNRPAGVGMRVTHGCLRLFPEDIEVLFKRVALNTRVQIVNQPVKFGWHGDELLLEVHPQLATRVVDDTETPAMADLPDSDDGNAQDEHAVIDARDSVAAAQQTVPNLTDLTRAFVAATAMRRADINWELAQEVLSRADGVAVVVGNAGSDAPLDDSGAEENAATSAAFERYSCCYASSYFDIDFWNMRSRRSRLASAVD